MATIGVYRCLRPHNLIRFSNKKIESQCQGEHRYTYDALHRVRSNKMSLKFVPKSPINNMPALVQIMAGGRRDDESLSGQMVT